MKWRLSSIAVVLVACAADPARDGTDSHADGFTTESMPPDDVPASLIAALGRDQTYVEDSCTPTTYPGWPYPAKKCTYRGNLVVTIANPPQARVARWILDASRLIPALDGLRDRDPTNWEKGLVVIARNTILQSSRIFPLDGQVWEDGTAYVFERGVTKTCSTGCYCRINSTNRQDWCGYAAKVLGTEDEATCLAKYGQPTATLTEPWLQHCFENHIASWERDSNDHYRARAWRANETVAAMFPDPSTADGPGVVSALETFFDVHAIAKP
jgi:hypothetical protein